MKKILLSSAAALTVFCLEASASAKAQEFFFPNAYSQPVETVEGIDVGTRNETDIFAPAAVASAPAVEAQRRQVAHVTH